MPTALELGPEGWKPFLDGLRRKVQSAMSPAGETERAGLVARARDAATVLKRDHGARRVVLFGSLAHSAWFDPQTDVDLAVEGLLPGVYWHAWRAVERFFLGRRVDLIEYETASVSLRAAIDRDGVEL